MKIENVEGIVWDLDGTLLDSFGVFEQIVTDVIEESGHKMPSHEFMLNNFHGSLEETVQRILGIKSAEELDKTIGIFLAKQELHYGDDLESHLFMDASLLAQQAAKIGIYQLLVTNRAHEGRGNASPRAIIAATVLADCIHEVRSGDEVDFRKPDKRSIGDWMERHQIKPSEVIVIGDQFVDAQLALNIGARAVLIQRHGEIPHLDSLTHVGSEDIFTVNNLNNMLLIQ